MNLSGPVHTYQTPFGTITSLPLRRMIMHTPIRDPTDPYAPKPVSSYYRIMSVINDSQLIDRQMTTQEFTDIPWNQVRNDSHTLPHIGLISIRFNLVMGFNLGPNMTMLQCIVMRLCRPIIAPHMNLPTILTYPVYKRVRVIRERRRVEQALNRLTICMAGHPRIGCKSPIRVLGHDMINLIAKHV